MVCVLFLNCVEGGLTCAVVTTCQLQVANVRTVGGEGWGELTGNSGVTILCCLWSADVLTI
jgi:hypothetical protein